MCGVGGGGAWGVRKGVVWCVHVCFLVLYGIMDGPSGLMVKAFSMECG